MRGNLPPVVRNPGECALQTDLHLPPKASQLRVVSHNDRYIEGTEPGRVFADPHVNTREVHYGPMN